MALLRGSNNMFNRGSTNKVYPPGSNPRLASLLSSVPSPAFSHTFDHTSNPQPFGSANISYNMPNQYLNEGFGSGNNFFGAQGLRNVPYRGTSFSHVGYGNVGPISGGAHPGFAYGPRYHPYGQQQQQRAGFLEQLLKNRGIQQTGYPPYSRPNISPLSHSALERNNFALSNHQGYSGPGNHYTGAGYVHHPVPQQATNWNRSGFPNAHPSHPYNQHPTFLQGSAFKYPSYNPFYHHPRTFLPIIQSEPEDPANEDVPDAEIVKSEMRFRKNHHRMAEIFDKTMANCDPIHVSIERVESLRRHVLLLKQDVNKHREETLLVKNKCDKRLQDFQASSVKFAVEYNSLCQPVANEKFNELVEKYYHELKHKSKRSSEPEQDKCIEGTQGGNMFLVNEVNGTTISPSSKNAINVVLQDEAIERYFDQPLFIDIPVENGPDKFCNGVSPPLQPSQQVLFSGECAVFYGREQLQEKSADYTLFPPEPRNVGSGSEMGNLLLAAQPQEHYTKTLQPQSTMRWHQGNPLFTTSSLSFTNEQNGDQQHEQSTMQNPNDDPSIAAPPQSQHSKRSRPSEELHDFILGLVHGKLKEGTSSLPSSHHISQLQEQSFPLLSTPAGQFAQSQLNIQAGHSHQRRLLSGGGIVEVKQNQPVAQNQTVVFEDAAPDWIHAFKTCDSGDNNVSKESGDDIGDTNDNISVDANSGLDGLSSPACTETNNGKSSKIAEILGSPCLNEGNTEDFESDLRQLEDVLNGSVKLTEVQHDVDEGDKKDADRETKEDSE